MKKTFIVICALLFIPALFCELPVDPAKNPANASAKFTTINNVAPVSLNEVIAGATVAVGFNLNLPDFIDSVKLTIVSSQQNVERTYVVKAPWEAENLSTPVIFPSAGTKTCVLTCFRSNGTTSDASLIFVVAYQPGNHPPTWSPDTVELTSQKGLPETRSLLPYAKDPDGNPVSFTIALPGNQFTVQDSRITAMASIDTGRYFISVIISDGELQDTGIVAWKIFAPLSVHAVLTNDSACTTIDSLITIDVLVNDAISSGTLLLSSVTQPANGLAAIKNNKAVYIPASGFAGVDTFNYVVNGIDTGSVTVNVTATSIPSAIDTVPPAMHLMLPQIDSAAVNASSAAISIEATDASGIVSVTASFGATELNVSAAAPVYSVTVTNLPANQFNTVRFIATDSSGNGNRETLLVTIKYDPSISDATGPVFKQISGPVSGSIITNPLVTIVDSITDPSGIDSVFWSLNSGPVKSLTAVAGKPDQFSLTATVERENLDTIIITAVDKSAKRNRSTRVAILKYVVAPVITIQPEATAAVIEGLALKLFVTATGTPALKYQWYKNNVLLSGENTSELNKAQTTATDSGTYHVIVSNGSGTDIISSKSAVTIKITAKITEEPQSKEANEGGSATFTVKSEGDAPVSYLWLKDDTVITGANAATYTLSSITKTDDKRTFRCVISNSFSKDTSAAAVLTVIAIPIYNVSFAVDGGTDVPDQSIKQGGKATKPATNPTKEGFVFGGWYTDPAFSTEFDFSTQTITADRIIYAKWIKTYTLTIVNYPTLGGSVSKSPNTIAYASGASVSITAIENSGYRFKNWTGDHSSSTNPAQITMTKDYTITANFLRQYTVNFSAIPSERGNVTTPATSSVVVDSGVALDIAATPAAGFKFKKWTSSNAGVSFVSSTSASTRLNITQDVSSVGVQAVFGCITFRKNFPVNYAPHSVVQGDDGSYGVLCNLGGSGTIIKLNASGDSIWEKNICNLGEEQASLFPITKIQNGFMAGSFSNDTTFCKVVGLSAGSTPATLFAWNPCADFNITFWIRRAFLTNDGGYLLAGYKNDWPWTNIIKTDASRLMSWTLNVDSTGPIVDCQQTQDNGYVWIDENRIVKVNNTGTIINFSTPISNLSPSFVCQINTSNGYLVGGSSNSSVAGLVKISPDGVIVSGWPKYYSNTTGYIVSGCVTFDGSFVFSTNEGNFVKTNSEGDIIWNKKFPDSGLYYIALTNDGGFIISFNNGNWILKTDENGDTD